MNILCLTKDDWNVNNQLTAAVLNTVLFRVYGSIDLMFESKETQREILEDCMLDHLVLYFGEEVVLEPITRTIDGEEKTIDFTCPSLSNILDRLYQVDRDTAVA